MFQLVWDLIPHMASRRSQKHKDQSQQLGDREGDVKRRRQLRALPSPSQPILPSLPSTPLPPHHLLAFMAAPPKQRPAGTPNWGHLAATLGVQIHLRWGNWRGPHSPLWDGDAEGLQGKRPAASIVGSGASWTAYKSCQLSHL